jgi:hypothetical protein
MSTPTAAGAELSALLERFPLPEEIGPLETVCETVSVNGVGIHLAGIATELRGECATGSAAALDGPPVLRSYMELVERLSILAAIQAKETHFTSRDRLGTAGTSVASECVFPENPEPSLWRWARSSGVAVGPTWEIASARARFELAERDRVLRSWYGQSEPASVAVPRGLIPPGLEARYSFEAYSFGWLEDVVVAGLVGFPRAPATPALLGFAARGDLLSALEAAFREFLQPLGFLLGEELPRSIPEPSPTPDFHQDYFLFPSHADRLRAWLRGEHSRHTRALTACTPSEPLYADLTPPALHSKLFVVKAIPNGHVPLAFGPTHPFAAGALPAELRVHPIA